MPILAMFLMLLTTVGIFAGVLLVRSLAGNLSDAAKSSKEKKKSKEEIRLKELELEKIKEKNEHKRVMKLIEDFTSNDDDEDFVSVEN